MCLLQEGQLGVVSGPIVDAGVEERSGHVRQGRFLTFKPP